MNQHLFRITLHGKSWETTNRDEAIDFLFFLNNEDTKMSSKPYASSPIDYILSTY